MTYGLTQKLIKRTRERFQSGELTYEEAMWFLGLVYSDNLIYYIHGDVYDNRVETLIKALKNEN